MSRAMTAAKTRPRPRHVPQRTCLSCGSTAAKRELVRLVRTPAGGAEVDATGKRPGRGAYLCHNRDCWQQAVKKGRLDRALRATVSRQDAAAIIRYADEHLDTEAS